MSLVRAMFVLVTFFTLPESLIWAKIIEQAGAELRQAQLKLGLNLTLIFCSLVFSRFGLVELLWLI